MPAINWVKIRTFLASAGAAPRSYIPIGAIPVDNADAPFAEAAATYSSTAAMLDDGWLATDEAYLSAIQYFGQTTFTPTPPTRLVIVKRAVPVAQVAEFTVVATADGNYNLFIATIGGTAVLAATVAAVAQTVTQIKDALIVAFNLGAFAATHTAVSSGVDTGTVTADIPGVPFALTGTGPGGADDITEETTVANAGIYEDLDAAFAIAKFWAVIPDPSETEGMMIEAARWVEGAAALDSPRRNVALLQTADTDIVGATEPNFSSVLVGLGYTRSFPVVHSNATDKMSAAYFGRYGGQAPGTRAWHYGRLGGSSVTAALNYTETQVETAVTARVSIVERDGPAVTDPLRINWGQGSGGFFVVQKQAEDAWWFDCGVAIGQQLESIDGVNLDELGIAQMVAAVNEVNAKYGTGEIPVLDLDETTTVGVALEDVPDSEEEVGDYQTTGGITVTTVLTPKIRRMRVSATFALA